MPPRWTQQAVRHLLDLPFGELVFRAASVHREHFDPARVQISTLLSIKTGGCPEDCAYCPQSASYEAGVAASKLMDVPAVLAEARAARDAGATRFCMGAAWRSPKDRDLDTLDHVRDAGINVCCGGIVGMGEAAEDRAGLIAALASLPKHPESVPINALVRVEGTPLADAAPIDAIDFVRVIAAARITMPAAYVRLSAGREAMTDEAQALCFLAGANSIFYGPRLLTTANPAAERDRALLRRLGINEA